MSEHVTCMDSKFCEQNPKHITGITSPSKPHLYHKHAIIVKNAKITYLHHTNARELACDADE